MVLAATFVAQAETKFNAISPDGLNEVRLEVGENGMAYSVWRRSKALVEPTEFSIRAGIWDLKGREVYLAGTEVESTALKVEGTLKTPLYKKSSIDLAANETLVRIAGWAVRLHARNDGVAWRFETDFGGDGKEMLVTAESTNITFPKGTELCYTVAGDFMSGWEKPAQIGPVVSVPAGHPQIVMTPFTATVPGAGVVTVTESDLRDYPGLNFYRRENEPDTLRSWQAGVPNELEQSRRKVKVKSRRGCLAKTSRSRTFPWRVFVLGDTPSDLVASDAVYALASPSRLPDVSWIKPGQVAWDWWNGFQITDVPGLETGCNFETYKAYVDFAAANGIAYIIMDEGWAEKLDPEKMRDEVNVPGVIEYAKGKGVGVILWAAWSPLTDRERRLRIFDRYAAMGAKGFKIDFIERDDQDAERFLEETAADAAQRKLVVLYHGIHKPTGLQRTYPNILNYEGVYGLEQGGRSGGRKVVISNDVNLVYTRMVAGFMDYTPGAMRNRAFDAPPFDPDKDIRACYGTRCHQLALFPLFEAPIQMLCDSPTQYRTAPECTAFITKVPTVWDETVGVAGEIGKFAAVARRKGGEWWLGAITDWTPREIELPTAFLGEGEWKVEAFEDASDADVNAEHYVRREFMLNAGEPLKVHLAPGGGFAARFTPASKASASICEGVESMKVMTYNIRYSAGDRNSADNNWEARRDDLANLVESANPDVAGFQEVLPDQRKWLEARFPGYAFVGDGRNADRVNGEASPIAFRKDRFEPVKSGTFWLSETPDEPGSKSWKAAFPRICSYAVLKDRANGKTFAFANTHTDHASEEAREKGMLLVIERMKEFSGDAPVVFVGDHNCLEYEKPAKAVAKLLKDALYLSETPPEGSWRTFNYWSYKDKEQTIAEALAKPVRERSIPGGKSDSKRIDYIYVSPGTRVLGYRTIAATRPGTNLYPSDHFPSVAEVVLGATPATPKVEDFKVKLTGVAIMPTDDDEEDEGKSKVLPPQTRIVVTPGNLAVFFLEYSFPPNVKSRMYLGPNFDEGVLGEDPFGTSASGLITGNGKITKVVLLGAGGDEPYEKDLLLKSVRIRGELEAEEGAPRNNSFFICDMPVNVLFANKADSDGRNAVVLPPKPAPAPDPKLGVVPFDKNAKPKSSTPAGFTDNLDEALATAKKDGKFVYVCFSGSDWCGWCQKLEREVFAQPEFIPAVEKDYVLVFIDSTGNKGVLSDRAKKENPKLVKKYGIAGFPTALILDGDGKKVGETGYRQGGAEAYASHLVAFRANCGTTSP